MSFATFVTRESPSSHSSLRPPLSPSLLIRFAPPLPGPPAQYHHRMGILVDIVVEFVVGLFMPSRRRKRERPKNG